MGKLLTTSDGKLILVGGKPMEAEVGTSANIQTDKSVTITANGTTSITPDAPYDAMDKVDVTVNVASGGGVVWVDPE